MSAEITPTATASPPSTSSDIEQGVALPAEEEIASPAVEPEPVSTPDVDSGASLSPEDAPYTWELSASAVVDGVRYDLENVYSVQVDRGRQRALVLLNAGLQLSTGIVVLPNSRLGVWGLSVDLAVWIGVLRF